MTAPAPPAMSEERLAYLKRRYTRPGTLSQELLAEIDRLRAAPPGVVVPVDAMDQFAAVIGNARAFVRVADEFWPEYPEAIGEHLSHLGDSIDRLGKALAGEQCPVATGCPTHAEIDVVAALTGGMPLEEWRRQFTDASLRNDIKALLNTINAALKKDPAP